MPRVDFYIFADDGAKARYLLACRIIDKVWQQVGRVFVSTEGLAESQVMDELLWCFREDSFLPHQCYQAGTAPVAPIVIGHEWWPEWQGGLLLNLAAVTPAHYECFQRIVELVPAGQAAAKQQARERYRYYRDLGCELHTHDLTKSDR